MYALARHHDPHHFHALAANAHAVAGSGFMALLFLACVFIGLPWVLLSLGRRAARRSQG